MNYDPMKVRESWLKAIDELFDLGFRPYGDMWLFIKNGIVYDLSAADLNQIDRIERDGLFVVPQDAEGKQ